jgi:hypothetical protein
LQAVVVLISVGTSYYASRTIHVFGTITLIFLFVPMFMMAFTHLIIDIPAIGTQEQLNAEVALSMQALRLEKMMYLRGKMSFGRCWLMR